MSWRYHQNNGLFEHDGHSISEAYAGKGQWRNQARYESIRGKGPLPRGRYTILPPLTHPTVGLYALRLVPAPTNHMYGRSGFLIHGPNPHHLDDSSEGCIVASSWLRHKIWNSGDHMLEVVP